MPRIVRPDPLRSAKQRFGSPVGSPTRRSIKRNKELTKLSIPLRCRQMARSGPPLNFLFVIKDSRGTKERNVRKCLRKISQLSFITRIVLLGEKPQVVSHIK
jgi:hypothetical protein